MEELMNCPRSGSLMGQQQQQQQPSRGVWEEDVALALESGSLWVEEFAVDELLNLEFMEEEKEGGEQEGEVRDFAEHKKAEDLDSNTSSCSASSATSSPSFEPAVALTGIGLPAHDAEELEWVSRIMDDSLWAPQSQQDDTATQTEDRPAEGPSLVSPAVCLLSTQAMVPVKAKRSKRSRSAAPVVAWSLSGPLLFVESSTESTTTTTTTSSSSSFSSSVSSRSPPSISSCLTHDHPSAAGDQSFFLCDKQKPKKRGRKPKPASSAAAGERRCAHCGAQRTPQWRAGPLGAKTLCNACGVRFKSGRLLPEYRPACSPTFVNHIHSNCHRKVLEMRQKKETGLPSPAAAASPVPFL
ncbi:GATA transcription factor 6-like [Musa acuminata AAA Group]|uniref:GATA transcription factor 6-like n=1 Tax=Musa acuminata AAA Group TaxID=214697 RepID=UPI0031D245FC